jgi:hypothetical protein
VIAAYTDLDLERAKRVIAACGLWAPDSATREQAEAFVARSLAEERERCARICDEVAAGIQAAASKTWVARTFAARIREGR